MKAVATLLLTIPLFATSASADTTTTQADTLVVVTPHAPVVVQQDAQPPGMTQVGDTENPPSAPQRQVVAAPSPAPQNEQWENVSHINGTPVKVGERVDYLKTFRKTNVMANPFGVFFGHYDISASHAVSQNLAVTVAVTGWNSSDYDQGMQISATLPLYFRRTYSGPYLEGGLLLRVDTDGMYEDCYDCTYAGYTSEEMASPWIGPQLMLGWHWTFDSGLNVAFAVGMMKRMDRYSNGDADPTGYFRVGYAF